eukprot:1139927-Pelagomonas_calceolata.AAC.10
MHHTHARVLAADEEGQKAHAAVSALLAQVTRRHQQQQQQQQQPQVRVYALAKFVAHASWCMYAFQCVVPQGWFRGEERKKAVCAPLCVCAQVCASSSPLLLSSLLKLKSKTDFVFVPPLDCLQPTASNPCP